MRFLLKNSHGHRDGMWTLSVVTLIVLLTKTLLAGTKIGSITIGPAPDGLSIGAYLGATLTAYVARRNRILGTGTEEPKP